MRKQLAVAIIGAQGGVGKGVVRLLDSLSARFRIVLLANSRYQVVLNDEAEQLAGSDLLKHLPRSSDSAGSLPDAAKQRGISLHDMTFDGVVRDLCARPLKHATLLIECTASQAWADKYPALLSSGVNIATPNKKAFAGSATLYEALLASRFPKGGLLYHQSTVGGGMPWLSSLDDMINTGDSIKRIEVICSGTLGFLLNAFSQVDGSPAKGFSQLVDEARRAGDTEPNPADDLAGSDVARKLCILARRLGSAFRTLERGYLDVPAESLIPKDCQGITDGEAFVRKLASHDGDFERRRAEAHARGKVLRYTGYIDVEKQEIRCGLQAFDFDHKFATSLGRDDQIIMVWSERYSSRPFIMQGAGDTVTGVVTDCLRVAERFGV